jgi:hypothetical protein
LKTIQLFQPLATRPATGMLSPFLPQIGQLSRIAERMCTTLLTLVFADLKNTGRTLKESCRDNKKQANQSIWRLTV